MKKFLLAIWYIIGIILIWISEWKRGHRKYKVGDKVRAKSLDWYNENKDVFGKIWCDDVGAIPFNSQYCGKVMTISGVYEDCYTMVEDLENYYCNEMIERKVEE